MRLKLNSPTENNRHIKQNARLGNRELNTTHTVIAHAH